MIAAGAWLWAIGDVYWNFKLAKLDEIPYPSLADFFYIAGYPALYAGIAMLTRARLNRFEKSVWLDGLIGALAVAAIGAAFLYPAFQGSTEGNAATVAVNLAYPLGDLLLAAFVVAAVALSGWRPDRELGAARWRPGRGRDRRRRLPAAGGDRRATRPGRGPTRSGSSARSRSPRPPGRWAGGPGRLPRPRGACSCFRRCSRSVGVGVLIYDHFERVSDLAIWLSGASLVLVVVRMVACLRGEREAASRISVGGPHGFRSPGSATAAGCCATWNGSPPRLRAGSGNWSRSSTSTGSRATTTASATPPETCCSARLGQKLSAAVEPHGVAYRLGGDEFCVLAALDRASPEAIARSRDARPPGRR